MSMKDKFTRRAALKLGGGSGLGLFSLLAGAGQEPMGRGGLLGKGRSFRQLTRAIAKDEGNDPEKVYRGIMRAFHAEQQFTKKNDLDELDHDISCLRSVSPAAKLHMQRQRAVQYDDWVTKMRKAFDLDKGDDYNWY